MLRGTGNRRPETDQSNSRLLFIQPRQQDCKAVTTGAGNQIFSPEALLQQAGSFHQDQITPFPAFLIIGQLQVIKGGDHHTDRKAPAAGKPFKFRIKVGPIIEAGHRIMDRQIGQLFLPLPPFRDIMPHAEDLRLSFFIVGRRVIPGHPDPAAVPTDGFMFRGAELLRVGSNFCNELAQALPGTFHLRYNRPHQMPPHQLFRQKTKKFTDV